MHRLRPGVRSGRVRAPPRLDVPAGPRRIPGLTRPGGRPHPTRACGKGGPCNSLAPLLRRLFRGSTHTLLPASPTPPAPAGGDTLTLLQHPPPRPRLRRSSPAPSRGRGPCVAISGEQPYPGCSRRATVPGSSPGSPRALDRVDIATGGGADGEGELVPPPLSPTLQIPYFPGIPHPTRACGAPPPPPPGGGVRAWRYLVSSRIRGDTW